MTRRLLLLVALVAGVVVAAGCGSKADEVRELPTGQLTKAQYEEAFADSAVGLAAKYGVGKPLDAEASAKEQAAHVVGLQKTLREWATRLESLTPPAEAAAAQARYVAGIRGFATDLDRAKAALDRGDTAAAKRLLTSAAIVSPTTRKDLVAARKAFHDLDYDLEDLDTSPVRTD